MILVDTSAWIEFDRATGSAVDARLTELIRDTDDVVVTEPVVAEVLAGARDDRREQDLRRLMERFPLLRFEPAVHFDGAVRIYRTCRAGGVTPRGLIDCMIAAVAVGAGVPLLAHDVDLSRIADVVALELDPATLRPARPAWTRDLVGEGDAAGPCSVAPLRDPLRRSWRRPPPAARRSR